MSQPRLEPVDEKSLRLSGIHSLLAHCLFELPEILRLRDQPKPRQRLLPDLIADDPQANLEWHRLMDGELYHLFASAGEVVIRDLTQFEPHAGQLTIPLEHVHAWMSALNQARLILGAQYDVTEPDMDQADLDFQDARQKALIQIHLLGWLLQLFVEHENPDSV